MWLGSWWSFCSGRWADEERTLSLTPNSGLSFLGCWVQSWTCSDSPPWTSTALVSPLPVRFQPFHNILVHHKNCPFHYILHFLYHHPFPSGFSWVSLSSFFSDPFQHSQRCSSHQVRSASWRLFFCFSLKSSICFSTDSVRSCSYLRLQLRKGHCFQTTSSPHPFCFIFP